MASTKQEQIDRLKAQLDSARKDATEAAMTHAQVHLGPQVASVLEFSQTYARDEESDLRWYSFRVDTYRDGLWFDTPIRGVDISSDGQVRIDANEYPLPVEDVVKRLEADMAAAEEPDPEPERDPRADGWPL